MPQARRGGGVICKRLSALEKEGDLGEANDIDLYQKVGVRRHWRERRCLESVVISMVYTVVYGYKPAGVGTIMTINPM